MKNSKDKNIKKTSDKKSNIQLYVFDIDGVLLTKMEGINVSVKTKDAINNLQKNGKLCTVATGRGFLMTKKAFSDFRDFKPNAPLIVEDCKIVNVAGKTIYYPRISEEEIGLIKDSLVAGVIDFACFCLHRGLKYRFLTPKRVIVKRLKNEWGLAFGKTTNRRDEFFRWARAGTAMIAVKLKKEIVFPEKLNANTNIFDKFSDICPGGFNKGVGVISLAGLLGIPLNQVAVFGNDFNDVSMFRQPVGVKVAIGEHCPRELLDLSTHHFDSAEALDEILEEI